MYKFKTFILFKIIACNFYFIVLMKVIYEIVLVGLTVVLYEIYFFVHYLGPSKGKLLVKIH